MNNPKELMARAMAEATRKWSGRDLLNQTELAQAANDALESNGYAIVPLEPSDKMLSHGDSMMPQFDKSQGHLAGVDVARDVYRAMLQAHKEEGE